MEPPKPKTITRLLSDYLNLLLGAADKVYVKPDEAHQIQAIDFDEQYCHVEWPSDGVHLMMEDRPRVWRIADWKTDYNKTLNDKAVQDLRRRQWNTQTENMKRLVKKLMYELQTDDEDFVLDLAKKLLKTKTKRDFVRQEYRVYIEEMPEK